MTEVRRCRDTACMKKPKELSCETVEQVRDDAVTAKLNEIYATEPSNLDPILQSIQTRSVGSGRK